MFSALVPVLQDAGRDWPQLSQRVFRSAKPSTADCARVGEPFPLGGARIVTMEDGGRAAVGEACADRMFPFELALPLARVRRG